MKMKKPSLTNSSPVKGSSYMSGTGEARGGTVDGSRNPSPRVGVSSHTDLLLRSRPPKVSCRASGAKYKHRGCYEGAAIQNLPSSQFWVDPDPCPALVGLHNRRVKRERKREKGDFQPPEDSCRRMKTLKKKAKMIVGLLGVEQSLKPVEGRVLPDITCGGLRKGVRSMFPLELTLVQELSIKTSGNAEAQPCPFCKNLQEAQLMEQYEKARYLPVDVDREHLSAFEKAFAGNVPDKWNNRAGLHPYVPNGAGSLEWSRGMDGNWNEDEFSRQCRVVPVFTKGKWRTVTAYSSFNVGVLSPLHDSLYDYLKRRNWLLVGSPTDERLRYLQHGCEGNQWLSFDYVGATDNIKTAYVQRAVEILIDKGEGLTDDEVACLRVVAELRIGDRGVATMGQPMGSPMSFPLLCLINKTIVDMALSELLIKGEIEFKEWTRHRCLINGDDLLTKSTSSGSLAEAVFKHGLQVGMKSNWEKTLASTEYGEINSTVFENCIRQKKTNVSALWMSAEVTDVLGYAHESCRTVKGFLKVVSTNRSRLARQKIKTFSNLPFKWKEALLSCGRVKSALTSVPVREPPKDTNLFSVIAMPEGYDLSRAEEAAVTRERVRVIRQQGLYVGLACERRKNAKVRKSIEVVDQGKGHRSGWIRLLKPKRPSLDRFIPECFAKFWENKRKEQLLAVEADWVTHTHVSDLSRIELCLDLIKVFKDKRNESRTHTTPVRKDDRFCNGNDYVSLADAC